jgi:transcriptional regulator GlxA family with amidase domain
MPHRIVFLVFPRFQQLDLAGPLAAFEIAQRARPGSYRWRFVASEAGGVASSAGLPVAAQALASAGSFDTLLVCGGDGVDSALRDVRLLRWLQRVAASPVRVASVCSGSLLLAAAGVLDGRRATTHWSRTREFRRRFPQVRLEPDRIYVRDGQLWTSAGITAGIDLALALIGNDHGDALSRLVAQHLVVYHRRPGGQSQFSPLIEMERIDGRFGALLGDLRGQLAQPLRVQDLAERACMSPRHFARAFRSETGSTPARAVERLRVDAARAALQSGAGSVQQVAERCGFGRTERMRRSFLRLLGMPPAAVKRKAAKHTD